MESQTENTTKIEIHFYATPYHTLLRWLDWRGILLKAHINWLGQHRTHCSIRVISGGLDLHYQATWDGLIMSPHDTLNYDPVNIIDVSHAVNPVIVLDNLEYLFQYAKDERITLNTLLKLMKGKHTEVIDITCTSFIADALGIVPLKSIMLYPDKFHKGLLEWLNACPVQSAEVQTT